jgi:hypothetical protein
MRRFAVLAAATLLLAGCGGTQDITAAQVRAMSDEEAIALLDCQMRKAADDLGQQEAVDRYGDALVDSVENDGEPLQLILWDDGYRCPEMVPGG